MFPGHDHLWTTIPQVQGPKRICTQHGATLAGGMTISHHRSSSTPRPLNERRRTLLLGLYLVYLALLVWVVIWKLEVPSVGGGVRNLKLAPFVTGSNGDGASEPVEVWGNLPSSPSGSISRCSRRRGPAGNSWPSRWA